MKTEENTEDERKEKRFENLGVDFYFKVLFLLVFFFTFYIVFYYNPQPQIHIYQSSCNYDDPMKSCNEKAEIEIMQFPDRNVTKSEINQTFLDEYCQELKQGIYACKRYLVEVE